VLQTIYFQVNHARNLRGRHDPRRPDREGRHRLGAEFAKLCNKPLFVFDQDRDGWFQWSGESFDLSKTRDPTYSLLCTGTRFLTENGALAIDALFDRSFAESDSGRATRRAGAHQTCKAEGQQERGAGSGTTAACSFEDEIAGLAAVRVT